MDVAFWYLLVSGAVIGWVARSHVEHVRRVEQRRIDYARRMHPSTRPLHIIDDGWNDR